MIQQHWDARAAANFMLGGTGAGLVLFAGLAGEARDVALAGGLALMGAGLAAVWHEIGKKLRAPHVFFNPFTSWMTREAFAAVATFGLGIAHLLFQQEPLVHAAAASAAFFLYSQARILHAARGIPAWRVREVVPLIVSTGLAEGAGLALALASSPALLALFAMVVATRAAAWQRYKTVVPAPALAGPGHGLLIGGTAAALVLAVPLAPLAGLAAVAAGWWLKLALVTRAAELQPFALARIPVRGTRWEETT